MASFEERKQEVADGYARAAASQNLRLFRETMNAHQALVLDDEGDATGLLDVLRNAGWRVMGKPVTAATIVELVDLVSDVREGMTGSQRLTLFMQDLLGSAATGAAAPRLSQTSQPRRLGVRPGSHTGARGVWKQKDYPQLDLDGQSFGEGATKGIVIGLGAAAGLGAVLYLLSLVA